MIRVFLDANVLFSAAYRANTGVRRLWEVVGVQLVSSAYAVEEARRNLDRAEQRNALDELVQAVEIVVEIPEHLEWARSLVHDKDAPILAAARGAQATVLLTGDVRHFGVLMDRDDLPVRVSKVRAFLDGL